MLTIIAVTLAVLWLIGLAAGAGSMIHLVLLIAVAVFAYDMYNARRHHTSL